MPGGVPPPGFAIGMTMPWEDRPEPVLPSGHARRVLTVRWWIDERWNALALPLRREAEMGSYMRLMQFSGGAAPGGPRGIGRTLLVDASPTDHRHLARVFEAIAGPPAPPPPGRDAILATLAQLDRPGEIAASPNLSATAGLALIAEQRGVEVVIDPVLLQFDEGDRARLTIVRDTLYWRARTGRAWVAGDQGRALLTDPDTRDLLSEPRMYRLRVPAGRVHDARRPRLDAVDPLELARAALRMAAPIDPLWHDVPTGGVVRFVARTAPDEHALLTWLIEQIESTLATGAHSPPSAADGRPIIVYNLAAHPLADRPEGLTNDQALLMAAGEALRRTQIGSHVAGARPAPWQQRSGCPFRVRLTPEDHERFEASLRSQGATAPR
jgi:hypothetical protein